MKKLIGIFILSLVLIVFGMYRLVSNVQAEVTETAIGAWQVLDTTTSTGDEPTALAVGERTYSTVTAAIAAASSGDDEISIYRISRSSRSINNFVRMRCIGITDNQSVVYNVYGGTLSYGSDCALTFVGTLSFTIGTQVSDTSNYEFADTITVTEGDTTEDWLSESPESERVAEAAIDLQGMDILVLVATTAGCDCKLLGKFY
ncbi:MAG: hypothetical protein ACTSYW_02580 [Candidatus Heimdallarchaeota archaeon]